MTSTAVRIALVAMIFYTATTAEAAKGVKKENQTSGQQIVTGVVTTMAPDGNGGGSFLLRTTNQHKKTAVANGNGFFGNPNGNTTANPNGNLNGNQFHVTPATQFHHVNGNVLNGSALHVGARVRVMATGNQAANVQILSMNRSMGNFTRYGSSSYRPQIPHHNGHHHRPR